MLPRSNSCSALSWPCSSALGQPRRCCIATCVFHSSPNPSLSSFVSQGAGVTVAVLVGAVSATTGGVVGPTVAAAITAVAGTSATAAVEFDCALPMPVGSGGGELVTALADTGATAAVG